MHDIRPSDMLYDIGDFHQGMPKDQGPVAVKDVQALYPAMSLYAAGAAGDYAHLTASFHKLSAHVII